MKLQIALLTGGYSSEREVSLKSAAMVGNAFDHTKYDMTIIDVQGHGWIYTDENGERWPIDRNDFSLIISGEKKVFDYAFIMIHGSPGEDGELQGYLETLGIPYSTCDQASAIVTFNKDLCKRTVAGIQGINLARQILLRKGESMDAEKILSDLDLPLFIKPNASGSSCGITKVKNIADIPSAINAAFAESDEILMEEFIAGREFACGVLVTKKEEYLFPVTEIISKRDFFDYQAKYTEGLSDEITPADIPASLSLKLQSLSLQAYKACGCRGLVRVDFIVNDAGAAYMVEMNSIPGMSSGSIVPKQVDAAGMTMTDLIDIIIEDTFLAYPASCK